MDTASPSVGFVSQLLTIRSMESGRWKPVKRKTLVVHWLTVDIIKLKAWCRQRCKDSSKVLDVWLQQINRLMTLVKTCFSIKQSGAQVGTIEQRVNGDTSALGTRGWREAVMDQFISERAFSSKAVSLTWTGKFRRSWACPIRCREEPVRRFFKYFDLFRSHVSASDDWNNHHDCGLSDVLTSSLHPRAIMHR